MQASNTVINGSGVLSRLRRERNRIAERLVLELLSRMKRGRLEVELPDGTTRHFGKDFLPVPAKQGLKQQFDLQPGYRLPERLQGPVQGPV